MAGFYPDVPSWRMPWHRDGSLAVYHGAGDLWELSSANRNTANNESTAANINFSGSTNLQNEWWAVIFPELRDLDAYFVIMSTLGDNRQVTPQQLQVSVNTTNSVDGDWTTIQNPWAASNRADSGAKPWYRSNIHSVFATSIKAVRFRATGGWGTRLHLLHLYGEMSPGQSPNRLELRLPGSDVRCGPAYFDWGDPVRGTDEQRAFRVKNLSSTLTANDVIVSFSTLTDGSPSNAGQHTFSTDGGASWLPQVNIGTLAAGALSAEILIRRSWLADALLSVWSGRIGAIAASWTS